jgi:D-sedoheptulose 7-phosphate isomerase
MSKIKSFTKKYIDNIYSSIDNLDFKNLEISSKVILNTIKKNSSIFVCGNGGSAAIANHYVVDFLKFFREKTKLKPRIYSLTSNVETLTAISNDINYKNIFSYQAENYCKKNDLLIIISSSGNSENIKEIIKFAKKKKIKTIGFSGFKGGFLKKNADISIHVNFNNYGISEDAHQILMHIQLQYLISIVGE